jgi:precorrin-6Y C5,15-methyltransferase (decarboxylating)
LAAWEKVHIVGIGDDGLEGLAKSARQIVAEADMLIGAEQTLAAVPDRGCERVPVSGDYDVALRKIADSPGRRIVVLTSGDPLFYGVARYLCEKLGKDRFEVTPHVSSMQLAFARVKESWDEAYLADLATVSLDRAVEKIRSVDKAGLFTTDQCSPSTVAQAMSANGIDYFHVYVCENLGTPDERVTRGELEEIASQDFSRLNVMILVRKPGLPDRPKEMLGWRYFGNPDDAFLQSRPKRGLLTPMEVRTVALAELDLGPRSIVWDVGAGSGAVGIEAARIAHEGQTFAIEMDSDDFQLIRDNAQRIGVSNLTPVLGRAPEAWAKLPDPDAVFVGGTGRMVSQIVAAAFARLRSKGRIAANVSNFENVTEVSRVLRELTDDVQVRMIQISHATVQLDSLRFESRNPTFLITAMKSG